MTSADDGYPHYSRDMQDAFRAEHPRTPPVPVIPTIEVLASINIGGEAIHHKLVLSVPQAQKYRDLHGTARRSVEQLFAAMVPLVSDALAKRIEETPGGQFQGD